MKRTFKNLLIAMLVLCTFVGVLPMLAAEDLTAQAAASTVYYDFKKGHPGSIPSGITVAQYRSNFSALTYSVVAGRNADIDSGEWAYSNFSATGTNNANAYASYVSTATGFRGILITTANRDNNISAKIKFKVPNGGKYVPYLNIDGDSYPDYAGLITARIYNGSTKMYEKEIFLASYPDDENYIRLGNSKDFTAGGEYILEIAIDDVRTYAMINGLKLAMADSVYISAIDPTDNYGVYEVKVGQEITIPYTQLMSDGTVSTSTQSGWKYPLINGTTEKENTYLKAEVVSGSRYYRITGKAATSTPQTIEFKNNNGCAPSTKINVIVRASNYSNTATDFYYDFEKALPINVSAEQVHTIGKHVIYGNTAVGGYGEVKKWTGTESTTSLHSYPWKISSIASTVDFSPIYQGYGIQNKRKGVADVRIRVPVAGTYMPQLYLHNTSSTPGIQSDVTVSILNSAGTTTYSSVTLKAGTSSDVVNLSRHGITLSAGEYIVRFNKTADHASDPNLGANYYNGINLNKTSTTTVTLDPNGGTANSTTQVILTKGYAPPSIDDGKTVPSRTGYRFGGFYDTTDTSGTQWYNKDGKGQYTWTSTASTDIFYAHWNVNTYHLIFNANGGSGSMSKQSINYDVQTTITANAFTRTGYTFAGWATSSGGSVVYANKASVKNLSTTNQAEINLYAKWTAHTYTVKYNGNGSTGGSTADSSHTYGTAKALTSNGFTKTGYTFAGWATSASGDVKYSNGQSVSNLTSTNGGTVTLYAKWTPITYTIAYNGNGNTGGSTASSTHTYDTAKALTSNGFTKTGYSFNGWNTKADGSGTSYANSASVKNLRSSSGTVNLYAQWKLVTYSISYTLNGGSVATANPTSYTIESAAIKLNNPTRNGYTFKGWTGSNGSTASTSVTIAAGSTGDKSYTANWTANKYTVTLSAADATTAGTASVSATYGSAMPSATMPKRTGYTFKGFYDATSGGTQYYTEAGASARTWNKAAATTLYAQWTANTYSVKYNANNGTGSMSNSSHTYDKAANLTANAFTRPGYTFKNWNTKADGTGTSYADQKSVKNLTSTSGGTVNLYAQWTPVTYNISYTLNSGTVATANPTTYTIESAAIKLNNPTRTGYTFKGWTGSNGSTASTSVTIAAGSTGDKSYTANWTANKYTVKYDANGGTGTMDNSTHTYDTAKTLTANAYTRDGYTFAGWATSASGAKEYNDKASVTNLTSTANGTVTLYAVWKGITYYVEYNANGGTGTMENSTHTYGTAKALTANTFTKDGYTFAGWATSTSGSVAYADKASVSTLTSTSGGTVTLYAQWTANKYTVTLDRNKGTGGSASVTATYGSAMPSMGTKPTRTGYTFKGYYDATSGGTQYYTEAGASAHIWDKASDTTLYARWTVNKYTVTLDANGGSGGTESVIATYASNMPNATMPTRDGYTFEGYFDENGTRYYNNDGSSQRTWNQAADTTLYAHWTANKYTVTLSEGGTVTATYNSAMPAITVPTKTGYTFGGYYIDAACTGTQYYKEDGSSARNWTRTVDTTLYAKWTPKTYTITLHPNTGTAGTESVTATYGAAMPAIETLPTRTGYTFAGFYAGGADTGVQYYDENGASVKNWDKTANTTLYAKWTANTYTVTLSEGGTVEATYGSAMPAISVPEMAGKVFAGYYDGEGGTGKKYYNANGTSANKWDKTEATTLYVKWNDATVTLTDPGDKSVTAQNELSFSISGSTDSGMGVTYSASDLPAGATFSGNTFTWTPSLSQIGLHFVTFKATDDGISATVTITITVNAPKSAVTLNEGGSVTATYGEAMPSIEIPEKIGYIFAGYFDGENGTGTKYYDADGASARNWDKADAEVTLYANWIQGEVTITPIEDKMVAVEQELTFTVEASSTAPSDITYTATNLPEGATFNAETGEFSWVPTVDQVGEYTIIFAGSDGLNFAEVTVKVVVNEIMSTVSFDEGNGNIYAIYGESLPSIEPPKKTGFVFDGYYDGEDGTGKKYYNLDGTPAVDAWDKKDVNVTLYAKWVEGDECFGIRIAASGERLHANNPTNARYSVYMFAGIDTLNYEAVGFEMTVNGVTMRSDPVTHVYKTIKSGKTKYSPTAFGANCNHIIALEAFFPESYKDYSFTFRPYAIKYDGTIVYGKMATWPKIYSK